MNPYSMPRLPNGLFILEVTDTREGIKKESGEPWQAVWCKKGWTFNNVKDWKDNFRLVLLKKGETVRVHIEYGTIRSILSEDEELNPGFHYIDLTK